MEVLTQTPFKIAQDVSACLEKCLGEQLATTTASTDLTATPWRPEGPW